MDQQLVKLSKFLSLVLRHQPERIGLSLDRAGRAEAEALGATPVDLERLDADWREALENVRVR